jgi:predicted RNase H-like nuclease (RuvC/YqgF family)
MTDDTRYRARDHADALLRYNIKNCHDENKTLATEFLALEAELSAARATIERLKAELAEARKDER